MRILKIIIGFAYVVFGILFFVFASKIPSPSIYIINGIGCLLCSGIFIYEAIFKERAHPNVSGFGIYTTLTISTFLLFFASFDANLFSGLWLIILCFVVSVLSLIVFINSIVESRKKSAEIKRQAEKMRQIQNTIFSVGDFKYRCLNEFEVEVIGVSGFIEHASIPSEINGYKVVSLSKDLFRSHAYLKTVKLPDGLIKINNGCFALSKIKSIAIPDSVEYLGTANVNVEYSGYRGVFEDSMLEEIRLGNKIKVIGAKCFQNTNIKKINLSNTITIIDKYAFANTLIDAIKLPSIKVIAFGTFFGCSRLVDIDIPEGVETIERSAFGQCLNIVKIRIPFSAVDIDEFFYSSRVNNDDVNWHGPYGWGDVTYYFKNITIYCYDNSKGLDYALKRNMNYRPYSEY